MTATYRTMLDAYLTDPNAATLAALRRAIRSAPNFDPDLRAVARADALLAEQAWAEAVEVLEDAMPGAIFSPGVHARLATALRAAGRLPDADRHARLARAALDSITATGDGTVESPWSVLRVADEYDVLDSLGARPVSQAVHPAGERAVDVVTCEDGREVCFDVVEMPSARTRAGA